MLFEYRNKDEQSYCNHPDDKEIANDSAQDARKLILLTEIQRGLVLPKRKVTEILLHFLPA